MADPSRWQMVHAADHGIVLFDGHCALCSRMARFIWRRDRQSHFRFASLQSGVGARLLSGHGIAPNLDTVVLIEGSVVSTGSTAVLQIARHLGWPWKLLTVLLVIPRFLRDPIYKTVARRRYRRFGKNECCAMTSPGLRQACIDVPGPME